MTKINLNINFESKCAHIKALIQRYDRKHTELHII